MFLDDGRIEIDSNVVERAIRPIPMTRKAALFAGSDGGARHWAIAMTLIQTAKLNGVEPMGKRGGVDRVACDLPGAAMPMIGRPLCRERPTPERGSADELSRCCDWSDADYAANGAMIGSRDAIQFHGRSVSS